MQSGLPPSQDFWGGCLFARIGRSKGRDGTELNRGLVVPTCFARRGRAGQRFRDGLKKIPPLLFSDISLAYRYLMNIDSTSTQRGFRVNREPERRRISLSGRNCELGLVDWGGSGPVLLLAHANGFCADVFGPFVQSLVSDFHVIGYDARGHGESDMPAARSAYLWSELIADQVALVEELRLAYGIDRLGRGVGHSMGASIMLAVAARRPDLFESIDLIDPIIALPPSERTGYYAGEGQHPMAERARKRRRSFQSRVALRAKWEQRGIYAEWDLQALNSLLAYTFRDLPNGEIELKCDPEVEAFIYEGGRDLDLFAEVASLTTPARLFHSERGFVPRTVAEQLVATNPFLRLERLELGHFAPMEAPSTMASLILHQRPAAF